MREDWRYKLGGFIGWLAIVMLTLGDIRTGVLSGWHAGLWVAAAALFGVTYARYLRPATQYQCGSTTAASLAVLAVAGFTMVLTSVGLIKYLASITLTIVAGELPFVFSRRIVWLWVAAQIAALSAVFWVSFGWFAALAGGSAYAGFQVLSLGRTWLELRERTARHELTVANDELRATRALHDALLGRLTALSRQLDVAARHVDEPAAAHVQEARAITELLLMDIRAHCGMLDRAALWSKDP